MITIFVGDVYPDLGQHAKDFDPAAKLLTNHTIDIGAITNGTFYISLAELTFTNFINVLKIADVIRYCPPAYSWSDTSRLSKESDLKMFTEFYCMYFNSWKEVIGIELINSKETDLTLTADRLTEHPQLWAVGDSFTVGTGVKFTESWPYLLSKMQDKKVSVLGVSGASVPWEADQILRSDIRSGDIVIWNLTHWQRTTVIEDGNLCHASIKNYAKFKKKSLLKKVLGDFDTLMQHYMSSIYQVINFCTKVNAKLILTGSGGIDPIMLPYLFKLPNFIQFYGVNGLSQTERFLDLADDDMHPGPQTHRWYADELFKVLEK